MPRPLRIVKKVRRPIVRAALREDFAKPSAGAGPRARPLSGCGGETSVFVPARVRITLASSQSRAFAEKAPFLPGLQPKGSGDRTRRVYPVEGGRLGRVRVGAEIARKWVLGRARIHPYRAASSVDRSVTVAARFARREGVREQGTEMK